MPTECEITDVSGLEGRLTKFQLEDPKCSAGHDMTDVNGRKGRLTMFQLDDPKCSAGHDIGLAPY